MVAHSIYRGIDNLAPLGFNSILTEGYTGYLNRGQALEEDVKNSPPGKVFLAALSTGMLSAAEIYDVLHPGKIRVYGIEDQNLYKQHSRLLFGKDPTRYLRPIPSQTDHEQIIAKRSHAMVANALNFMQTEKVDKVIIIAGTAHIEGIEHLLENNNISFITIEPHGLQESLEVKNY